MKRKFIFILVALFLVFLPISYAHCPICTAAVGAAAISAKYYGFDASIIGLLAGAFGISTGLWIGLKIKKEYFNFQLPAIVSASFLLTAIPLLYIDSDVAYFPLLMFGNPGSFFNKIYWLNKIFLGSIVGGVVTLMAYFMHIGVKKLHGKVLLPFQGIAITVMLLFVSGLGLYFYFG